MKVYALFIHEYADYALAGVFSSKDKVESIVCNLLKLEDDLVYECKEIEVDYWLLDQFSNIHNLRDIVWRVEMSLDNYDIYDLDTQQLTHIKDGDYTITIEHNKVIDRPYYKQLTKNITVANIDGDIKLEINGKASFILAYSYISEAHAIEVAKQGYGFFKTHEIKN